jgi:hypothetical protein
MTSTSLAIGTVTATEQQQDHPSLHDRRVATAHGPANHDDADTSSRAIFVISMGKEAAKTKLVERFLYSARQIGRYGGWIVLLTDAPKDRYDPLFHQDWTGKQKLIVMNPLPVHYNTKFKHRDMTFKRFKTYTLEYVAMEPRLKDVKLVYYLDVDIVFVRPMSQFFQGLEARNGIGNDHQPSSTRPVNSTVWMFNGNAEKVQVQGGQMVLSVSNSLGCLERWRDLIDQNPKNRKDQFPLMKIWKAQQERETNKDRQLPSTLQCEIVRMQQEGFISFPNKAQIEERVSQVLSNDDVTTALPFLNSTLVHIKNTGSAGTEVNATFHQIFVRDLLRLGEDDPLGITRRMHMKAARSDMKEVLQK